MADKDAPGSAAPVHGPEGPRHPRWWVSTTYFAEGFPYALVNNVAEVLFKELGASLQAIGLTAIFHLPWNLKFLWAPVLDHYETKRRFLLGCEIAIAGAIAALFVLGADVGMPLLAIAFLAMAFLSATHDIAVDAFYLEALDRAGQSRFVGLRAALYRGAVLLATGPLLIVAGRVGWRVTWMASLAIMIGLVVYHWLYLPAPEPRKPPLREWAKTARRPFIVVGGATAIVLAYEALTGTVSGGAAIVRGWIAEVPALAGLGAAEWIGLILLLAMASALLSLGRLRARLTRSDSRYAKAFLDLLDQPMMGRALTFIVLFRTGESFLMKMRLPFLRDECGMDLDTYGLVNGTFGFAATLVATLLGGWLIARDGLSRWLWPMVLAQNVPNLLYVLVAASPDPAAVGTFWVGTVVIVEDFGAGLGTAVFMVYLMRCCDPKHKATHMAVLTAIMSIGFTIAGMASGFLVGAFGGFATYFAFSFVATVPSMLMLPFVPFLDTGVGTDDGESAKRPDPNAD